MAEGSVPLTPSAPGEVLLATATSDDVGTLDSWESRVHLVR